MEGSYLSSQENQPIPDRLIPRSNSTSNLFALSSTFSKLNVRNDAEYSYLGPNKKRHIYNGETSRGSVAVDRNFPVRSSSMTAAQQRKRTALFTARERNSYHEGFNNDYNYANHYQNPRNTLAVYKELTPYQLQRSRMKTSFQFPNGEIYKPKPDGKCSHSLRKASLNPRNSFLFKFSEKKDSSSSKDSVNPYNAASILPTSHTDINDGLNSLELNTSVPSTIKGSLSSTSPISAVNTLRSLTESQTDDDDSYENKTVTISYCFQNMVNEDRGDHMEKLYPSTKEKIKSPTKSGLLDRRKKTILGTERNSCKKSPSRLKLGSVLKKFWYTSRNSNTRHSKNDMKRKKIPVDDIITHSDENFEIESDIELMDANLDGIEIDDDKTLMDTDSIFDDLLSKEDNKYDSRRKQLEIRQKLHETLPNDDGKTSCRDTEKDNIKDVLIDETIIEDFSKLGDYIIDTRNQPPPRSSKRPSLNDNESARHFYNISTDLRESLSNPISLPIHVGSDMVNRLRNDWEYIKFEDRRNSLSDSSFSNAGTASKPIKKDVRFAKEVYLASTWSSNAYERANPEFIMNRHKLLWMMKVHPSMNSAMEEVKLELNSYKKNEMVVHENSKCFTHYLI
ncbi:Afr1p [Saccharomyces paradoxus]|uniref:Afr1p n=1 Tax=Saccharomyces paradoxus TaxID=27291 RepID=A0A8B8UNH8_SACPA|nr:Afr1 [Saccharomyces paradoxus]QHS72303.1 Afr1 [Saccharomyces paradoxus]